MSTVFYPLVTFVLLLVCIAYWAMTALYPLPTQPASGVRGGGGQEGQDLPTQSLGAEKAPVPLGMPSTARGQSGGASPGRGPALPGSIGTSTWEGPVEGACRDPVWPCFP